MGETCRRPARKVGRWWFCAALVRPVRGVSALADGVEGRCGCLGAAGNRIGGALQLADHAAEFEFQKFKDFPWPKSPSGATASVAAAAAGNLGFDGRRSRFRHVLSKQNRTPWGFLIVMNVGAILAFGREVMVNNCLIFRHAALLKYRNGRKSLILAGRRPIRPRFHPKISTPGRIQGDLRHGRPFPIQEHHAP